jgi:hypothetical protein
VLRDEVHALDDDAVLGDEHLDDLALLAAVSAAGLAAARDDLHEVTLLDVGHDLDNLRCQRDDLHELPVAKLATDRSEDTGAAGVTVVLEDHRGVLIELDVGAVGTTGLLDGADDDGLDHIALLDVAARDRVLDGRDDDVTEAGVAALGPAETREW